MIDEILMLFAEVLEQTVCLEILITNSGILVKPEGNNKKFSDNFNIQYNETTEVKRFQL